MSKKLVGRFLKDNISLALAYFTSIFLVLLYFRLEMGWVGLVYPLLIFVFIFLVLIIVRAINYYRFNLILNSFSQGSVGDLDTWGLSQQQLKTIDTMKNMRRRALNKEHQLQLKNKEKQKVISQIVHNIKTPASVIDLSVQNSKDPSSDKAKILDTIQWENRTIIENLDQVLSYLPLDQFHHDYVIQQVDLASQVRDKINQRKESFILNNVFPKMATPDRPVMVLTDKKWNGVLLDQLISNAIKYTAVEGQEGQVSFGFTFDHDRVALIIQDTGIGIPPMDLKRVYEPFFTGENGRRVKASSGIGLYICQRLARELNHDIKITSQLGQGTKVTISYLTKM